MPNQDVRWKQRFENYVKSLNQLTKIKQDINANVDMRNLAVIKTFELTFELAWQVMKDFLTYQSIDRNMTGSRDAIKCALQENLIGNGQVWIDMINDRNLSAHTYDENTAMQLSKKIINVNYMEFVIFSKKMKEFL
jgi:nucleotidyltransferase substrate binding protein (TIGR01987 family)